MKFAKSVFIVLMLFNLSAFAQQQAPAPTPNPDIPDTTEYFTLQDPAQQQATAGFQNPLEFIQGQMHPLEQAISLIQWILHTDPLQLPQVAYQRVGQFGRWINDPTDDSCMNTRAKVLVRDSGDAVTYKNQKNCVVQTGSWMDPYSGKDMTTSTEVQIDHVVPLKHAYLSGAWRWDYKTRCLYANFMAAQYHLKSVSGHENMSKGDKSPDQYMPPDQSFRCEYLVSWLKIKAIWGLVINKDEGDGIAQLVAQNNCDTTQFVMGYQELADMRTYIQNNLNYCALNQR